MCSPTVGGQTQEGIKLMEVMLFNGILSICEVWYDIREDDVEKLKHVDEYLLRSVIRAPAKTLKETLYLESGYNLLNILSKAGT